MKNPEKVAIERHCSLRSPDSAPVVLSFHYETNDAQSLTIQHFRNFREAVM